MITLERNRYIMNAMSKPSKTFSKQRVIDLVILLSSLGISGFIIAFYSFYIRACIVVGYPPAYNDPDPKLLHFESHEHVVDISFDYAVYSFFLGVIMILLRLIVVNQLRGRAFWTFCVVSGIVILTFMSPFMEWFGD